MSASIAAAEQARRLDPRIRTSGAHTYFMLGDYEHAIHFQHETLPYLPNLALVMLGRTEEARASLAGFDVSLAGRLGVFMRALLTFLEGDEESALTSLRSLADVPDPEGRYYVARALARYGRADEALPLLAGAVEDGFFCLTAFTRDPWLDSLRGAPEFAALVRRAETRHRQAVISFLTAEGDRVLGVAHPV